MAKHDGDEASRPSSVEFVYDAGLQKIHEQMGLIDSLDVKMGALIGFLGALIVGAFAVLLTASTSALTHLHGWWTGAPLSVAALLVGASLYFAFEAFRMRQYQSGARFQDLYEWANEEVGTAKREFLPTLLEPVNFNDSQLKLKQENARLAVFSVFLALLVLLLGECMIVVGLL